MNQEKRNEILEAFASSKPTEFDGFLAEYLNKHPEQIVEPLVSVNPTVEDAPTSKRKRRTVEPETVTPEE